MAELDAPMDARLGRGQWMDRVTSGASGFRVKEQRPSFLKLGLVKKIEILPLSLYSSLIPHSFRNAEKRIYHQ